jgi:type II secretory pathway pseudopilin PulG
MGFKLDRASRLGGALMMELVATLLIVGIRAALASAGFASVSREARLQACRNNQRAIVNAVHAARVRSGAGGYAAVIAGGIHPENLADLEFTPACPAGGEYELSEGVEGAPFEVRCTRPEHQQESSGVDATSQ